MQFCATSLCTVHFWFCTVICTRNETQPSFDSLIFSKAQAPVYTHNLVTSGRRARDLHALSLALFSIIGITSHPGLAGAQATESHHLTYFKGPVPQTRALPNGQHEAAAAAGGRCPTPFPCRQLRAVRGEPPLPRPAGSATSTRPGTAERAGLLARGPAPAVKIDKG